MDLLGGSENSSSFYIPQKVPEDIALTKAIRNALMKKVLVSFEKLQCWPVPCKLRLIGDAAVSRSSLASIRMIGFWNVRSQVAILK